MGLIAIPFLIIAFIFGLIAAMTFITGIVITIVTAVKSTDTRKRKESVLCGVVFMFMSGIIMLIGLFFYGIFDTFLQTGF